MRMRGGEIYLNNGKDSPCKWCTDERHVGCHAHCRKWDIWTKEENERKRLIQEQKRQDSEVFGYWRSITGKEKRKRK